MWWQAPRLCCWGRTAIGTMVFCEGSRGALGPGAGGDNVVAGGQGHQWRTLSPFLPFPPFSRPAPAQKAAPAYTSKDLAGLKVFHGLDEFKEGESVVLTMKDKGILDDKGAWRGGRLSFCRFCVGVCFPLCPPPPPSLSLSVCALWCRRTGGGGGRAGGNTMRTVLCVWHGPD
jgi:hypothetical protein